MQSPFFNISICSENQQFNSVCNLFNFMCVPVCVRERERQRHLSLWERGSIWANLNITSAILKQIFCFLFLLGLTFDSPVHSSLICLFVYMCQIATGIEKQYFLLFAIFLGCQAVWKSWLINVPDSPSIYHKCKWTVCGVACFQDCADDHVAMVTTEPTGSWDGISNAAAWNLISAPRLFPHISISLRQIEFQAVVSPMYSLWFLLCKIASLFYTLMIME